LQFIAHKISNFSDTKLTNAIIKFLTGAYNLWLNTGLKDIYNGWAWRLTNVIPAIWEWEISQVDHSLRSELAKILQDSISTSEFCTVVHSCHPSYVGGIGRRITVWSQPRQNRKTSTGTWVQTPVHTHTHTEREREREKREREGEEKRRKLYMFN
jgi:hypothetical protein